MYTDQTLTCVDCGTPFTFSASQQQFLADKGFNNKPSRCQSSSRTARRSSHIAGRLRRHHIRILPRDHVEVEISPYDVTKGCIIYRSRNGEVRH